MALLASRKMENISRKGMLYMKTLANNCLKSFQLKAAFEQRSQVATEQNRLSRLLYSKSKEGCLKRAILDAGRAFKQVN